MGSSAFVRAGRPVPGWGSRAHALGTSLHKSCVPRKPDRMSHEPPREAGDPSGRALLPALIFSATHGIAIKEAAGGGGGEGVMNSESYLVISRESGRGERNTLFGNKSAGMQPPLSRSPLTFPAVNDNMCCAQK